jgi:hypothetical protein
VSTSILDLSQRLKIYRVMDKGAFTLPYMSALSFDDLPEIFANVLRENLSNFLWRELYHRPKRVVSVDISESNDPFWQLAIAESAAVGPDPIVLVPYNGIGEEVTNALIMSKPLVGLQVSRDTARPSGGGSGYLGSIGAIAVYGAQISSRTALLCSGSLVREICYGVVHGKDDLGDFSFVDGVDPEKSQVRIKFAQRIQWATDVFVEFALDDGTVAETKGET